MEYWFKDVQQEYGYSDYEIAKIKYVLACLISEFSKLFIFGFLFIALGYPVKFIISIILLLLLRTTIGGIHCKHYITCLILTLVILVNSIIIFPSLFYIEPITMMLFCLVCMCVNYYIGPIASPFRPAPNSLILVKCRNNASIIIFLFILLIFLTQN